MHPPQKALHLTPFGAAAAFLAISPARTLSDGQLLSATSSKGVGRLPSASAGVRSPVKSPGRSAMFRQTVQCSSIFAK